LSLGRSSALTALALTCLASALLLSDVRPNARVSPSQWLILAGALAAFTGLTGIMLVAPPLYRLPRTPVIGLSLPTAVSLLLTSMGLLLARATSGLMRVATSPGPGGSLLRRLALPVVIAPLLRGLVVTQLSGARAGVEVSVPVAILAAGMAAVSLFLLVVAAGPLDRAHLNVEASRARAQSLVDQAPMASSWRTSRAATPR
jgi:hypothetical protein